MNPEEFENFCKTKQMTDAFKQHFFRFVVFESGEDLTKLDYDKVWNNFLTECAKLVKGN